MARSEKNFAAYAKFYDAYYASKDYKAEVDYVLQLLKNSGTPKPKWVVDLGCGTGGHLIPMAKRGIKVEGIDRSSTMIDFAKKKLKKERLEKYASAAVGDICTFSGNGPYDAAIAMFAVIGYLTDSKELKKAFRNVSSHLTTGGLFVFDVWFGPTVLHELPETRIQEFRIDGKRVLRLVQPTLDPMRHCVDVKYTILTFDSPSHCTEVAETHSMRFFFPDEIANLCSDAGMECIGMYPFMGSLRPPVLGDWSIAVLCRKSNTQRGKEEI